jgi:8-oxo-dGTP pyrophosphatase MutT (NUDIX family)
MASTTTPATPTEIVAAIIYRTDPKKKLDFVLLEERLVPAQPCGGACGTVGFPGGKIEHDDLSPRLAMRRELSEELAFATHDRVPYDVVLSDPIGTLHLGQFRITVFSARIPPTVTVACTPAYQSRVRALHWRRPEAVRKDFDCRMMASTKPLLALVPFPPGGRHAPSARKVVAATQLPASGSAAAGVPAPKTRAQGVKRQLAPALESAATGHELRRRTDQPDPSTTF